jgi:hypothetical protein
VQCLPPPIVSSCGSYNNPRTVSWSNHEPLAQWIPYNGPPVSEIFQPVYRYLHFFSTYRLLFTVCNSNSCLLRNIHRTSTQLRHK